MARTGQSLPEVTAGQRAAVEVALRRRNLAPRVRERLEMVKAAALGQGLATIGRWSGRSPRTIRRWVGRFAAGGIPALADAPRSGRPAVADGTIGAQRRRRWTLARARWGCHSTSGRRSG
jgi:transposase